MTWSGVRLGPSGRSRARGVEHARPLRSVCSLTSCYFRDSSSPCVPTPPLARARFAQSERTGSTPKSGGSAPRSTAVTAATSTALRKRGPTRPTTRSGGSHSSLLRFYTDEQPGLKIGPTAVLVLSLLFIAFVVLLHIWGKFRRG